MTHSLTHSLTYITSIALCDAKKRRKRLLNKLQKSAFQYSLLPVYKSNFFFFSTDTHSHHDGNLNNLFCHRQHSRKAVRKILVWRGFWIVCEKNGLTPCLRLQAGLWETLPTLNDFLDKSNQNEMNDNSHIPATVLVALLQLFKSWPVHHIGLKPNCADCIQLPEMFQIERKRYQKRDFQIFPLFLFITCFQHFQRTCWRFLRRKSLESVEAHKVSWSKRSIL